MNYTAESFANSGLTQEQINRMVTVMTPKMQVTKLTEDEIRLQGRDYNAQEWDRIIDRMMTYNPTFYRRINSPNEYQEFFAVYVTSEGIKFFNTVSYSGAITSTGLVEVAIDEDGYVRTNEIYGGDGKYGRLDKSCKKSRKWAAERSQRLNIVFTSVI